MSTMPSATASHGSRPARAARAGPEWGARMMGDPQARHAPGPAGLPDGVPHTAWGLPALLGDFAVQADGPRSPATGETDEGGLKLAGDQIKAAVKATASLGAPGRAEGVERRDEVRLTACKTPGGPGPRHGC